MQSYIDNGYNSLLVFELSKYYEGRYHVLAHDFLNKDFSSEATLEANKATARKEVSYLKNHANMLINQAFNDLTPDLHPFL